MKAINAKFTYDDVLWTDNSVLNDANFDFITSGGKSKYQSFNTVSFNQIRTSDVDNFANNFKYILSTTYSSAKNLFAGPGIQISSGSLNNYFNNRTPVAGKHGTANCGTFEAQILNIGINQTNYLTEAWGAHVPVAFSCDWNGWARFGQRVNGGGDNITSQGWGASAMLGDAFVYPITQLLWVK
jgi:hypothetical protein